MKSEHRHELQTNELGRLAGEVAPFFERNGSKLLAGFIAIVVLGGGAYWWMKTRVSAESAAWTKLLTAQTVEDFAGISEEFPGTAPAAWAQLNEANSLLQDGIRDSFTNREAALANLKLAQEKFDKLVAPQNLPRELRVRALFGLARCLETTSNGDLTPAIEAYKKIAAEFTDPIYTIYRENSERRIKELETGAAQEFYAWFAKQNPKLADRPRPQDGKFHDMNPDDLELPMTLPGVPEMLRQTMSEIEAKSPPESDSATPEDGAGAGKDSTEPEAPALPEESDANESTTEKSGETSEEPKDATPEEKTESN
ncbi:MAG: hypothetical protein ACKVT0_05255 [Planctomycetaceae bacterium]